MADSWNKKEREKKKQQAKKIKEEKKLERKEKAKDGSGLDDMMAYIDEFGNISSTPPDPNKKVEVNVEDIVIGVPKAEDSGVSAFEKEGIVEFFNTEKGYGFIKDLERGQSFFVHINDIEEQIKEGNHVTFESGKGPKGPIAMKVRLVK